MNTWRLIQREIAHRTLSFATGTLLVAVAAGSLVAQFTLLRAHDLRTGEMLDEDERIARKRLADVENEMRKLTLKLGFNVRILPKDQNLADFYDKGFADKTMGEDLVHRLANSELLTSIRHLYPKLERKVEWPEQGRRTVILLGTHGEVPLKERLDRKKPIITLIPEGHVDVGHELSKSIGLKPKDKITFMGEEFIVRKCRPEQGTRADITVWMDLRKVQQLLKMPGRINEIQAVECKCAFADVEKVRAELRKILPGTDPLVTMRDKQAYVRKQARVAAAKNRTDELAEKRASRDRQRRERKAFGAVLVPMLMIASAVWVGLLAFGNVRERSPEIGILRAIGLRSMQIFAVFMGRALLIGAAGACIGYVAGFVIGAAGGRMANVSRAPELFSSWLLAVVLVAAPLLAVLATWLPARAASRQDPALVLREK